MASSPSGSDDPRVPRKGWALPESIREQFYMPFGVLMEESEVVREAASCGKLITVGDVVTMTLLRNGVKPDLLIFDYKTKRGDMTLLSEEVDSLDGRSVRVENPPARITPDLVSEVVSALGREGRTKMRIDGEEDLAALVCAAYAPEGTCMVYGLPGKGMVLVRINRAVSSKARSLMRAMEELN